MDRLEDRLLQPAASRGWTTASAAAPGLAEAGREYVYAEVPAGHFDVLDLEATSSLQEAFLAYQLHPDD